MERAEEWRRKARVELELPSGMKVVARRPGVLQLAEWQRLPVLLASMALGEKAKGGEDELVELAEYLKKMLCWCCLDPLVPEEIDPKEIPWEDVQFLVAWALRVEEARALEGFRGGGGDAGGGGDGADLRAAAVGTAGGEG